MPKCRTGREPKPPIVKRNSFMSAVTLKGVTAFFCSTENSSFLLSPPNYIPSTAKSVSDENRIRSFHVGIWRFLLGALYVGRLGHFDPSFCIGRCHEVEPFKKFFPFAVADFDFHVFLRRKGGNHHPAPVRREGR